MARGERLELGGDLDRLPVALVALGRRGSLGADPLGLAGLVEKAAPLGQGGLGCGPVVVCGRQGVPVMLELGQGRFALFEGRPGLVHGLVGDLERARVALALGGQVVERPIELAARAAGAAIGAADRGLQAIAQRPFVARQVADLEVVDRGGRPEEALGGDTGQLGQHLVGERRVGDRLAVVVEADRPLAAGERLLDGAGLAPVLVVLLERRSTRPTERPPARPTVAGPRARRPCSWLAGSGPARGLAGPCSCRPRSARAPRSVRERRRCRARDSAGSPGRSAGGSSQRDLVAGEQKPTQPQGIAVLGGLRRWTRPPRARRSGLRDRG